MRSRIGVYLWRACFTGVASLVLSIVLVLLMVIQDFSNPEKHVRWQYKYRNVDTGKFISFTEWRSLTRREADHFIPENVDGGELSPSEIISGAFRRSDFFTRLCVNWVVFFLLLILFIKCNEIRKRYPLWLPVLFVFSAVFFATTLVSLTHRIFCPGRIWVPIYTDGVSDEERDNYKRLLAEIADKPGLEGRLKVSEYNAEWRKRHFFKSLWIMFQEDLCDGIVFLNLIVLLSFALILTTSRRLILESHRFRLEGPSEAKTLSSTEISQDKET